MSDDAGFVEAIRKEPGSLDLYLIYADWLEERGDPRGAFLRMLNSLAQCDGDPSNRLRELCPTVDPKWVRVMEGGFSRAGLDYQIGYFSHCGMVIGHECKVTLTALHQWRTYRSLVDGVPDQEFNDHLIQEAVAEGQRLSQGRQPHLIPPVRHAVQHDEWNLELLPAVTCIATFTEGFSYELTVVWFQDDYAPPIQEPARSELRHLDYRGLATFFSVDDL